MPSRIKGCVVEVGPKGPVPETGRERRRREPMEAHEPAFRGEVPKHRSYEKRDSRREAASRSALDARRPRGAKKPTTRKDSDAVKCLRLLSATEREQLGEQKILASGKPGSARHPSAAEWSKVRAHLLERSLKSNPALDPALTAYTPGETLHLLAHPAVKAWHRRVARLKLPEDCTTVVLVPCAKTKPWDAASTGRSKLYSAYHAVRNSVAAGERPGVYFVTISEPLGIVPEDDWADFPQYDNPGLFPDDAQRSGMFKSDWDEAFGERMVVPFDREAQQQCLDVLGDVVGRFLAQNARPGRRFVAFVDETSGAPTTHGQMLDRALAAHPTLNLERYTKRAAPRTSPQAHIEEVLDRRSRTD